ncbi:beta-galactosidase 10-like isoform X2 [Papaver somniferum]|uniref:beta-galactosidase 10-like isoform X2 n=1 Tax=Papaver somniferum TaxID=3469 RepID=UPI000E6F7509|nr:beta-galactosidase 10-like isoform X2 [Papaver somniferum]
MSSASEIRLLCLVFFLVFSSFSLASNVTYDHRSLIIDGQRKLFLSASIHYPRSVPAMWPGLIKTAKEGGINVIDTYVFWNGHELSPGNYYFDKRYDLVKFAKIVQQEGMYLILRIGPFVAAEWNFGGIPVWLHYVPGTVFRTDNEPFKYYMQNFTTYIVNMMKKEKLFASQGGPIILAQVENEYGGDLERVYGIGGKSYVMWAAEMAVSQNIGVPWIMCWQYDAPDPVIDTCNSFYCDQFKPNSDSKPKIWTENWPGWFKKFGERDPHRPVEDVAFSVARFFQKGGSVHNYYMYHGGTNFGRTSGGPFVTTSYDYDAPIDEYGIVRLPKWGHLKQLHEAIMSCEHALLHGEQTLLSLGPSQEADVFSEASGACAAFLSNTDDKNDKTVTFQNVSYHLPAWSVSILPDCKNVAFNTAKVGSQSSSMEMVPENLQASPMQWNIFMEKAGVWGEADFSKHSLVDHINTTKDTTDYLWYTTSVYVYENESFLSNGTRPKLVISSNGHALYAFINQKLEGDSLFSEVSNMRNSAGLDSKFESLVNLKAGKNDIAILGMTVGLQHAGPFYDSIPAGLTSVKLEGFNNGTIDLSSNAWIYKIGLEGEHLKIYLPSGLNSVKWQPTSEPPKNQPLTWYMTVVDPPLGDDPVGLDMIDMGKGLAWLNGEEIGRYWSRRSSIYDNCTTSCDYRGIYNQDKCRTGCGEPTQRWYHVPRSWFKPSGNILVIFEEKGGDPSKIKFSRRKVTGVCALISEDYPSLEYESWNEDMTVKNESNPTVHLSCPKGTIISAIKFASFGTPTGECGSYSVGDCHDSTSLLKVEKVCLNKQECALALSNRNFNMTLCHGSTKKLAVEAECSGSS